MVHLNKKEAEEIVRALSKIKSKKIAEIVKKIKFPQKKLIYVGDKNQINALLKKAFKEKRKVKINYYSLSSDEVTSRVIDIYQLHNDCVVAYCHLREDERTFVKDRINKVALLNDKYKIPKNWSPESIIIK